MEVTETVETDKNGKDSVKGTSAARTSGCSGSRVLARPRCLRCMCPIFRLVSPDRHGKAVASREAAWSTVHIGGEELLGASTEAQAARSDLAHALPPLLP